MFVMRIHYINSHLTLTFDIKLQANRQFYSQYAQLYPYRHDRSTVGIGVPSLFMDLQWTFRCKPTNVGGHFAKCAKQNKYISFITYAVRCFLCNKNKHTIALICFDLLTLEFDHFMSKVVAFSTVSSLYRILTGLAMGKHSKQYKITNFSSSYT